MRDRKTEALRIMEALSGVDQKLLERCGVETGEGIQIPKTQGRDTPVAGSHGHVKGGCRKIFWQQGKAWAACIALVAVGALSWGAFRFATMPHGSVWDDSKAGGRAEDAAMEAVDGKGEEFGETAQGKGDLPEEGGADTGKGADGSYGNPEDSSGNANGKGQETVGDASPEEGNADGGNRWTDGSMEADQGVMENPYQEITSEQARSVEVLGDYIPTRLPAGYSLESVQAEISPEDGSTDSLFLTWTRGMDYITLYISKTGTTPPATVDVDRPETYDKRLYGIPYGETVPEAYQESVMWPVFAWEDMSLEIVESRMVSPEGDSGDTNTPRGEFMVLYPDGVLVRFTGRGTPEEIWTLLGQ